MDKTRILKQVKIWTPTKSEMKPFTDGLTIVAVKPELVPFV